MQKADAAPGAPSTDEPIPAFPASVETPRWPNASAVLEALAALEEEFKAVLDPRSPASGSFAAHDAER